MGIEKSKNVPPFVRFCTASIPMVFDDSLSYYECLCALTNFIQKELVDVVNNNAELQAELNVKFDELKEYVDHYFDNLDVQEEINNKLDEMAENDELAAIMAIYLTQNLPIDDNFNITLNKFHDGSRNIDYVITRISPNTSKISYVPLKGAFAGNSYASAYNDRRDYIGDTARLHNALLISNADTIGDLSHRTIIRDGAVVNPDIEYTSNSWCIGITDEGELKAYDKTVSTSTLIDEWHIQNSWGGCVLMLEGVAREDLWLVDDNSKNNPQPHTIICQEYDSNDIVFLHIAGRRTDSVGLNYAGCVSFIEALLPNINIAYMFGAGGDSQLMYKGLIQNDCSDGVIRPLWDFIYLDANIDAANYANIETEIANGRNTDYTLHGLLDSFLPHDFTYLSAQKMLTATYSAATNCFTCGVDYNTNLKDGDCILVKFGDMSEVAIDPETRVKLNIHYNDTNAALYVNTEYGNRPLYPSELKNKVVALKWDQTNNRYSVIDKGIINYFGSTTSLNSIKDEGIYYSNNFTDKPTSGSQNGWFINIPMATKLNTFTQFYIERPNSVIWVRASEEGTNRDWKRFTFSDEVILNDPEVLNTDLVPNKDLDAFNNGKTRIAYSYQPTNRPEDADSGWIINIPRSDQQSTAYAVQIYLDRGTSNHGNMYIRQQENSVWGNWKKVTLS